MRWSEVIATTKLVDRGGGDAEVRGVQYDSRRVGAGDVFVAMRGGTSDGNRYIEAAIGKGAAAVVTDSPEAFARLRAEREGFPVALVEHGRRALAEASAAFFGHPEKVLKISAVTGTNGKTTTAFLLEQMLKSAGRKCVLLGTIETHVGDEVRESEHTTPESRDVLEVFAEGVAAGCTEAVMEMSSHALEQERVWGLPVDVAMFTNLTQDHLDYHGTMGKYSSAKAKIFAGVGAHAPRIGIVNADDSMSDFMQSFAQRNGTAITWTYGVEPRHERAQSDSYAENVVLRAGATTYTWHSPAQRTIDIKSPLTGMVNVYNLLAASSAALARGLTLEQIAAAAKTLRQVPGRFEVVPGSREAGFTVVVDYAHTDDALINLLALARDMVKESGGRVITMFGCGGDRDRSKRPKMGRAAGAGSDLVIVTSDNPRSEEPWGIIDEALVGVRETGTKFVAEVDRAKAIGLAIGAAQARDIVLLAGKGHEKEQIFASGAVAFDDVAEAARVLSEVRG
jgi:UDP-N-acetylmuramoyl-L-alanyl-D-glutamate--2,6-diaminopimelate ligase